jgi:hypothetical protein
MFATAPSLGITPLAIGDDFTADRLIGVLMTMGNIKNIDRGEFTADIAVAEDGLAVLNELEIETVWASGA